MKRILAIALALFCAPAFANTCTIRQAGATDQTVYVEFIDATTGVPNSGLAFNTSGIDLEYVRAGATAVDITEATQTTNGAHSDGGFVSVGHGRYRLDLPDAAVAAGVPEVVVQGIITGYIMLPCAVALSPKVDIDTIKTNPVINGGTLTFPSGATLASTTNITAGTIATVTNLTNAPTAGDFTATMKTSIGTAVAASAVASVTGAVGSVASGGLAEASYATTAGSFKPLGIVDQGTAQSATGTTLVLRAALAMADDTAIGMTLVACGSTQGYCQSRAVTDYVLSTDTATVATWTVTPSGTITYYLFGTAPGSAGGGATAAEVWTYGTRELTALDEDNTAMDLNATTIGTVTTATTATNLTNLPTIPANWLTAAGTAADFATEIQTGLATASALATVDTVADAIKVTTDKLDDTLEDQGGGTYGFTEAALAEAPSGTGASAQSIVEAMFQNDSGETAASAVAGSAVYEIVQNAGGGGSADWTANERTAMRAIFGIPGSGTTPADPTTGIMDTIRNLVVVADAAVDSAATNTSTILSRVTAAVATSSALATAQASIDDLPTNAELATSQAAADDATLAAVAALNNLSSAQAQTAAAAALTAYDPPTRAEATTDANSILAAMAALNNLSTADIRGIVIEDQGGTVSLACALSVVLAYAAGDVSTSGSTSTYKDPSGGETRISGTVTGSGNRAATATCPSY